MLKNKNSKYNDNNCIYNYVITDICINYRYDFCSIIKDRIKFEENIQEHHKNLLRFSLLVLTGVYICFVEQVVILLFTESYIEFIIIIFQFHNCYFISRCNKYIYHKLILVVQTFLHQEPYMVKMSHLHIHLDFLFLDRYKFCLSFLLQIVLQL